MEPVNAVAPRQGRPENSAMFCQLKLPKEEEPPIKLPEDIPSLVRWLGNDEFRERQAATARLREIGVRKLDEVVPALIEATKGKDAEKKAGGSAPR
jgi:hypothetical protein